MKLLHFTSEDGSLDAEYIVLTEEDLSEAGFADDFARSGFKLSTVAEVDGDRLHCLPTECELYRR